MLQLNWNLLCEIINLIVLCLLLKKFLIGPVLSVMEKRRVMIEEGLESARNSEAQAGELKGHYEEALQNAKNESARLVEEAKKRAQSEYGRIVGEAGIEASEVRKRADKEIEAEKAKAMRDLKIRIAEVALCASKKAAGEEDRAGADLAIYNQFVQESLKEAGDDYECSVK